jgi:hypothetical protein
VCSSVVAIDPTDWQEGVYPSFCCQPCISDVTIRIFRVGGWCRSSRDVYCRPAASVAERGETVRSSALPATAKIVSFEVKSKAQKLLALAKSLLVRAKSYNAATAT